MQRIFAFLLGMIFLFCTGCEGDGPRPTTYGNAADPKQAKPVEFVPNVKGAGPVPAAQNPGGGENGAGENPVAPDGGAQTPASGGPAKIDANKLETARQTYGFAIFLKSEIGTLSPDPLNDRVSFITQTRQGLDLIQLINAMKLYQADKNALPPTVAELVKLMADNGIGLPELADNAFYVYDPSKKTQQNVVDLEFLSEYVP